MQQQNIFKTCEKIHVLKINVLYLNAGSHYIKKQKQTQNIHKDI